MNVNTEDITVPWGQAPDQADHTYGKWRLAVFQDVQESLDGTKLYYLYDPTSDENCITTGGRKGGTSLVVFDTRRKCFVSEILLRVQGRVKFIFALPTPSFTGGTSFALVSQSEDYGTFSLHFWRIHVSADGLSLAQEPAPLLNAPISYDGDFICALREDIPEVVFISGPGLRITRINAEVNSPQEPVTTFTVPQADLTHFYDGFLSKGNVYFVSASPDGTLDYTRVHILSLQTQQLTTQYCQPDPQRGTPPPRREAGIDSIAGFIILAGGELEYESGEIVRLVDYWVLDLTTFTWSQIAAQMPIPLIEPRVTAGNSGNIYIWGDFDQPLPGMPPTGTHLRILRVTGLNTLNPPPYDQAINYNQ
uniref:CUB domain-containing protein n=1 Tax=Panagrellus redivivus TaxID=6233 RepID=A0A7E4ZYP7_PANRE